MITVIIPALNEGKTIANVVKFCLKNERVSQIIVVDDQSTDDTCQQAAEAGASVVISARRGKGFSMKEGIVLARNEILVFLDADIDPYPESTIERLGAPLLAGTSDFVKASFSRNAGRVTEMLAKPLLSILYPELTIFNQPLGGIIAGRKTFFQQIDFQDDYGADVGILIDMFQLGARIREVNIGHIENKSKPWQELPRMCGEVATAILRKALLAGKRPSRGRPLPEL
ncbi:MAG TPA: glycosyltransferase [Chitinophagaceae bacterium]|nr:glycosyltransferase [Chitinophagaceae bacterium]